jgi:VanZ family protein
VRHRDARFWRRAAAAWAVLILIILLVPGSSVPSVRFRLIGLEIDKAAHAFLFFVQAMLLAAALRGSPASMPRIGRLLLAGACAAAYGGLTELLQHLVPARSADAVDFLFDSAGIALALLILAVPAVRR